MNKSFTLFIFIFFAIPAAYAKNIQFESHQVIKNKALAYLSSRLDAEDIEHTLQIQHIDPRLKLKKCPLDIEISLTQELVKPGKNTLNIQCKSPAPWRVFITADVTLFSRALVAKYPLNKGHLIQKNDLKLETIKLTGLRTAYLSDPDRAVNHVLKRRVQRGDLISVKNLSKPTLIKKGDKITIIAKNNGFQISMKGTALTAGGKDDKIRVKNSKTKKIIQGIIFDAQTVKVTL